MISAKLGAGLARDGRIRWMVRNMWRGVLKNGG